MTPDEIAAARTWLEDLWERHDGRAWWHGTRLPSASDPQRAAGERMVAYYAAHARRCVALLAGLDLLAALPVDRAAALLGEITARLALDTHRSAA
jgi:hypothetical protein